MPLDLYEEIVFPLTFPSFPSSPPLPPYQQPPYPSSSPRSKLVDCLLDEIIGLSLALDRPVKMPLDLYEEIVFPLTFPSFPSSPPLPPYQQQPSSTSSSSPRSKLVDCLLDEIIGLSLALDRPIKMPLDLYEGTALPTRVIGRGKDGILQLEAEEGEEGGREGRRRDVMAVMENVKPAWEIASAEFFRSMDTQEKRLCLIKSGADEIPKRRKGAQELDLALLPFLDETVRREARIALATEREDWDAVAVLEEGKSARGRVKDRLRKALQEGEDAGVVAMLEEEYIRLTAAKIDPTQDEGSYQRDLDQDDWYLKNRRT